MLDRVRVEGEDDPDRRPDTQQEGTSAASRGWRLVGASVRGSSHQATGADREDAFAFQLSGDADGRPWFCIAVADGVGSARLARVGSRLAVETLVERVRAQIQEAPAPGELRKILSIAAWEAKRVLSQEAERREQPRKELGTTLLAVLGVEGAPGVLELGIFQAGNGLIACSTEPDLLRPLIEPGDETEDGSIYDLTSDRMQATWDDSRFKHERLDPMPWALILVTDGITDDLLPLREKAPTLLDALRQLPTDDDGAAARLLAEISYVKRGSGDDRTLVCALLAPPPESP